MRGHLIPVSNFSGVAPGQRPTLDVPPSGTYKKFDILCSRGAVPMTQAQVISDIEEIVIKVEGKVQRRYTPAALVALNALYGKAFEDGHLPIYLAEPHREGAAQVEAYAWGMADISICQIEVKLADAAVDPRLAMEAIWSPARANMGTIKKVKTFNLPVTATGANTWPAPKVDPYAAIHLLNTDINKVKILRDNTEVVNVSPASIHSRLDDNGLTPQAGWTHVVFDATGDLPDALPMRTSSGEPVGDFRVELDMSATGGVDILTETIGARD